MSLNRSTRRSILDWKPTEEGHPVCKLVAFELQTELRRARIALHLIMEGTDNPRRVAAEALEKREPVV